MARAFEKEPSTRNWKMSLAYSSCSMLELKITLAAGAGAKGSYSNEAAVGFSGEEVASV